MSHPGYVTISRLIKSELGQKRNDIMNASLAPVVSGLDDLLNSKESQKKLEGNLAILCHAGSVNHQLQYAPLLLKKIFPQRLKKIFSPQHGFVGDVQDNMVETQDSYHPYFKLPIHSLYSHTRIPTDEMLDGLDTILVDLQDVGTRIYTYIYTMTLLMKKCAEKDIKVVVLDRPNPIDGITIEGNILEENFSSFVGLHPLPTRHGLTIGEVAMMANEFWQKPCRLEVIKMKNWKREMSFSQTQLPWVMPSPNMPTLESAYSFVGTVLFEGTNISEGRGTTRSLEIVGHPLCEPFTFLDKLSPLFKQFKLEGFILRPIFFLPTFQKHQGKTCGGYQIHVTNQKKFRPWVLCQLLCQSFYHELKEKFQWKEPPYEYEYDRTPIDLINGTDRLRHWVEQKGNYDDLMAIENAHMKTYLEQRAQVLLY